MHTIGNMAKSVIAACAATLLSSTSVGQVTWDATCGTVFWDSQCGPGGLQTNWMPDGFPTINQNVSIPMGSGTVWVVAPAYAGTLIVDSGLRIGNSTLQLGAGGGFISNLNMDASFARIQFMNPGTELNLLSSIHWGVGTVSGDGTIINSSGTINASIDAQAMTMNLDTNAKFRNEGGAAATLRFLTMSTGATFENQAGATFTSHADNISGYIHNGVFTNAGTLIVNHAVSGIKEITSYLNMTGGAFIVLGVPNAQGTLIGGGGQFSGGTIAVNNDCTMRFQSANAVPYVFNGLSSMSGVGNLYIEIPSFPTADWEVVNPVTVNMTGTSGLVINSARVTLANTLTNSGKAKWIGGNIRNASCGTCTSWFINTSQDFQISGTPSLSAQFMNQAGARVDQVSGNFNIAPPMAFATNVGFYNEGEYRLIAGNLQQTFGGVGIANFNNGVFRKPDLPQTQNSTVSCNVSTHTSAKIAVDKGTVTFTGFGLSMYGGVMEIAANAAVALGPGFHLADPETAVQINGAGRLSIENQGIFRVDEDNAGTTVNLPGTTPNGFHLLAGGRIGGDRTLTVNGNFYWSGGTIGYSGIGFVRCAGDTILTSGSVDGNTAEFENANSVIQTGPLSFFSSGQAGNTKNWLMDVPTGSSTILSGTGSFVNTPTGKLKVIASIGSANPACTAIMDNNGEVRVFANVKLDLSNVAGLSSGVLSKGKWIAEPTGIIDFPTVVTEIGGSAELQGSSASFPGVEPKFVRGKLTATGQVNPNGDMENNGNTKAKPGPVNNPNKKTKNRKSGQLTVSYAYADHELTPADHKAAPVVTGGFVCSSFENEDGGVIRPGGPGAPGPFKIIGNLNLFDGGIVQIELAGTSPIDTHDQVIVQGNVALNGILDVTALPGYQPSGGEQYTILTATGGAITGTFDQVVGQGQFSVAYAPTSVVLTTITPPIPGDINNNGVVNIDDLLLTITHWGSCGPTCVPSLPSGCTGDANRDCVVDIDDLLIIITHWG